MNRRIFSKADIDTFFSNSTLHNHNETANITHRVILISLDPGGSSINPNSVFAGLDGYIVFELTVSDLTGIPPLCCILMTHTSKSKIPFYSTVETLVLLIEKVKIGRPDITNVYVLIEDNYAHAAHVIYAIAETQKLREKHHMVFVNSTNGSRDISTIGDGPVGIWVGTRYFCKHVEKLKQGMKAGSDGNKSSYSLPLKRSADCSDDMWVELKRQMSTFKMTRTQTTSAPRCSGKPDNVDDLVTSLIFGFHWMLDHMTQYRKDPIVAVRNLKLFEKYNASSEWTSLLRYPAVTDNPLPVILPVVPVCLPLSLRQKFAAMTFINRVVTKGSSELQKWCRKHHPRGVEEYIGDDALFVQQKTTGHRQISWKRVWKRLISQPGGEKLIGLKPNPLPNTSIWYAVLMHTMPVKTDRLIINWCIHTLHVAPYLTTPVEACVTWFSNNNASNMSTTNLDNGLALLLNLNAIKGDIHNIREWLTGTITEMIQKKGYSISETADDDGPYLVKRTSHMYDWEALVKDHYPPDSVLLVNPVGYKSNVKRTRFVGGKLQ
jgi:hypothetical protein